MTQRMRALKGMITKEMKTVSREMLREKIAAIEIGDLVTAGGADTLQFHKKKAETRQMIRVV